MFKEKINHIYLLLMDNFNLHIYQNLKQKKEIYQLNSIKKTQEPKSIEILLHMVPLVIDPSVHQLILIHIL